MLVASQSDKHNSDVFTENAEINKTRGTLFEANRDSEGVNNQDVHDEQGPETHVDLTETEVSDSLLCDGVINMVTTSFLFFCVVFVCYTWCVFFVPSKHFFFDS